jgi:dolichol-phosphate mannosyltransferase
MKLSIIIPAYNEEKTINELISRVTKVKLPKGITKEIIVVNDASKDSTKLKVQRAKLELKLPDLKLVNQTINQGKGAALATGFKHATGDIILIQDADLEYDPEDYPKLIAPIISGKSKVVYGSRLKHYPLRLFGSKKTPLVLHYLGNKFLTFVTRVLYGKEVTDMETCYKVFTKEVIKPITIESKRFDFEPEITAKILKKGYKIYEVPIKVSPRGYEEGKKITWKDGFMAVWTLIKYKFFD